VCQWFELILSSKVLPEIVAAAAKPLENVEKITLWGEGGSTKLVSDIMATSSKVLESVKESTGIDLSQSFSTMLGVKAGIKGKEEK